MRALLSLIAFSAVAATAAQATYVYPHCNAGSVCRTAMEENAAIPVVTVQNGSAGIGANWELGPVSPDPGSVAMCTATVGCDPVIRTPVIVENNCALSEVESLIGHPIEITERYDLSPRVFSDERMVGTMDYWPWRFNVFVDADGMITQAYCG